MKYFVFILILGMTSFAKEQTMENFLENDFTFKSNFKGKWNENDIILYRYTKNKNLDLGSEHISFVYDEDKKLMGLTRILAKYEKKDNFSLSKEEAKRILLNFLEKYSKDLLDNYKILWIDFHDEVFKKDEKKLSITGLKVKCQNLNDKKYFWLIIGDDKSIITFERDVIWDFEKSMRHTQKWLHDSFFKEKIKEEK